MRARHVRGTLPPSLIFAGPDGVGKRMAARRAGAVGELPDAVESRRGRPGSTRRAARTPCRRSVRGVRGVQADRARRARRRAAHRAGRHRRRSRSTRCARRSSATAYRPFEGRRRVVIIDDADALERRRRTRCSRRSRSRRRASMFVLVTSRPDVLLPTVRSRCQRLRFGRLVAGRGRGGADARARVRRGATRMPRRRCRTAASAGRSRAAREAYVEAREAGRGAARSASPRRTIRARRLDGAKALGGPGGGSSDRDELARRLHALSSMLRDLGRPAFPRGRAMSRQRRPAAAARAAAAVVRRRARASRVCSGRPGAAGARSQRQSEDRRRLARVSDLVSCSSRNAAPQRRVASPYRVPT